MLLIKDRYSRIGILGDSATITDEWKQNLKVPFKDDAILRTSYPLTGGACVVDQNDVDILCNVTQDYINEAVSGHGFNPAAKTIVNLWEQSKKSLTE